MIIHL